MESLAPCTGEEGRIDRFPATRKLFARAGGTVRDLTPEARLLLLCARGSFEPADRERTLVLIDAGIDWSRLYGLAVRHRLATLLYRRLNDIAPHALPKTVFARLWGGYEVAAERNSAMTAELQSLLRHFEEQGIPALPFKGPALAFQLYGDVALREFGDLDLLVRSRDLLRARDIVEARGYVSDYPLRPGMERKPLDDPMHYSLAHRHPREGFVVELHWSTDCRLFALPGVDDAWWERLPVADFGGLPVRSLPAGELLYLLCMHAARHHWGSLAWVSDLGETIRSHPGPDWRQVLEMAGVQGTLRILLLGFELARRLSEAPLPAAVQSLIADDPAVTSMACRIIRRFGVTNDLPQSIAGRISYELSWSRFWPPMLGYTLKHSLLPNMADWSRWDLPPAIAFLYYPLHFARLFSEFGASPARSSSVNRS